MEFNNFKMLPAFVKLDATFTNVTHLFIFSNTVLTANDFVNDVYTGLLNFSAN